MAITTTFPKATFSGNGVIDSFAFGFKVIDASDVSVYKLNTAGVLSLLTRNYVVAPNADQDASPGGTVAYPSSGTKLQSGETLIALRGVPSDQELALAINGYFDADQFEAALDKLTMRVQELEEKLGRCFKRPVNETPSEADVTVASVTISTGSLIGSITLSDTYANLKASPPSPFTFAWATDGNGALMFYSGNPAIGDQGWFGPVVAGGE